MTQGFEAGQGSPGVETFPPGPRLSALVIGDSADNWMLPNATFEAKGCRVWRAEDIETAVRICAETPPELLFMPLTIGGQPTAQHLGDCLARVPAPVVVVIASNEEINAAAEAMRSGAYDCLFKPFSLSRLTRTVAGAIKQIRRNAGQLPGPHGRRLSAMDPDRAGARDGAGPMPDTPVAQAPTRMRELGLARHGFVASSPQMQTVLAKTTALAASDAPIFLTGEVGTGKTTLARIVHELSPRAGMPFVTLDCAALTEARFETDIAGPDGTLARAVGGTVFFDEVFDLAGSVQARVLRLIETVRGGGGRSDVRFVAASGRDPRRVLREGGFRSDLFYRLHVAPIALPPLSRRDGDLPLIARTRLAEMSVAEGRSFVGFSDAAMAMLTGYDWPGNLRELINVIWAVVLMNEGPLVTPDLLPRELRQDLPQAPQPAVGAARHWRRPALPAADIPGVDGVGGLVGMTLAEIERVVIEATIRAEDGSVPRAARVLDVSPSTLYRKRDAWTRSEKD